MTYGLEIKQMPFHSSFDFFFRFLIQSIRHICRLVHWLSKPPEIGCDSWRFGGYNTILSGFSIFHTQKEKIGSTGGKANSGNDNLTFSHCSYYCDVSQHMEKEKSQNGLEKDILCLNSFSNQNEGERKCTIA